MPIFSYVVIPEKGAMDAMCTDLASLDYCEVIRSDNKNIAVLVTDTPDDASEKNLQKQLKNIKTLQSFSMTFGYNDGLQKERERGDHEA